MIPSEPMSGFCWIRPSCQLGSVFLSTHCFEERHKSRRYHDMGQSPRTTARLLIFAHHVRTRTCTHARDTHLALGDFSRHAAAHANCL